MNPYLPVLNSGAAATAVDAPAVAADTAAASTYTDVNALETLKKDPNSPKALDALAGQVEALFLQMMLKSMRDASAGDPNDSQAMGMYQDMFDKQVALSIAARTDLGLGAVIRRQLGHAQGAAAAVARAAGAAGPAAAPRPGSASLGTTPAQFVARVLPAVQRAAARLGVHPLGLLAQAALETGWGQRLPRTADGSPSYNLFGVKAGPEWTGARAVADTVEMSGGVAVRQRTAFRAYGSVEESVADFANLLAGAPRYREALAAGQDPRAYAAGLARAGYATDPNYAVKLNHILDGGTLQSALGARLASR